MNCHHYTEYAEYVRIKSPQNFFHVSGTASEEIRKRFLFSRSALSRFPQLSGWFTRRHSKYDHDYRKQDEEAKYLPPSYSVCVADDQQAQFQSWYYRTYKEQQKQCGLPDVPIDFVKKTKIFQNAPVKSWPWMVRFEKIFNLISTRYQNLKMI